MYLETAIIEGVRRKFMALNPVLDERSRQQWAATEAEALGWGGVSAVAAATGLARDTVRLGVREVRERRRDPGIVPGRRLRRLGTGRKRVDEADPGILEALDALVEPLTRGDPQSPLRWTCKSTQRLAEELTRQHHPVSARTVAVLLHAQGYSLQANQKSREGASHPDRNVQFQYINEQVRQFQDQGQPVISVDTKKKELVGDFKNGGRE